MKEWNEFRDGQNPRRGEIIVVKGKTDPEIYPYILIADGLSTHELGVFLSG